MPPQKQKFLFYLPSLVFFIWLYFLLANIIKSTFNYDPYKENSINKVNFSYKIESSNNEVISKLSRKFDISNEKEKVPQLIKNAFISAEDKRFLTHHGIDILGLIRASLINLKNGSIVEGGSTITQQASRLIFLNNELSFFRKIKEILISLIMDLRFSKNKILKISSLIIVERDSQKGIIIGNRGQSIKKVGTESRKDLEIFFNKKVFLELNVKVIKDWRKNSNQLKKLGYN